MTYVTQRRRAMPPLPLILGPKWRLGLGPAVHAVVGLLVPQRGGCTLKEGRMSSNSSRGLAYCDPQTAGGEDIGLAGHTEEYMVPGLGAVPMDGLLLRFVCTVWALGIVALSSWLAQRAAQAARSAGAARGWRRGSARAVGAPRGGESGRR